MHPLFVIAAGGTGAKVVESLIHLCAADLGPGQLHVLLLDVDQSNGNVERTRETGELYSRLHAWDWTISPRPASDGGSVPLAGTRFFGTDLHIHTCLDAISTVGRGGLEVHLRDTDGAHQLLDLLYNESEQKSQCEKGFLARPNLGSLVLGGHLREKFAEPGGGAADFRLTLLDALNGATPASPVALVVVGSIFGGTGASLFPVVCECVREAIRTEASNQSNWTKLAPVAVMLTPYFLPNQESADGKAPEGETVDPSRFLTDTANTLKHYVDPAALAGFKAVYLLGSNQPELTRLRFVDGAREQANPPFLEEVVAALAIFDAGINPDDPNARRRIYEPPVTFIEWSNLPLAGQAAPRLALLLELAAFVLLPARDGQELSGGLLHACDAWGDQFEMLPWYERLLGGWVQANFSRVYDRSKSKGSGWKQLSDANVLPGDAAASRAKDLLAEYAYRLLLWTRTALPDTDPYRLVKMGEDMDYALAWEVMCGLQASEIEPAPRAAGPKDNALVRLARAAAVALAKIASGQHPRGGLVNLGQTLPGFPGQGEAKGRPCALPIAQNALQELAGDHGLNTNIHAKFVKTEVRHN